MAARIAWWLNLDAPLELERLGRYNAGPRIQARALALRARMQTLLSPADVVLDGTLRAEELPGFQAIPFCPTPSAIDALSRLGFPAPPAPPAATLRELSRRAFAARLGQTLPGATYVTTLRELQEHVAEPSFSSEWLLKRDFSFAARERRRVRGGGLDLSTLGFAKRSFARAEGLQVEPHVQRSADFALHGYLTEQGTLLIGEPMLQHCDVRGVWQSSELLPTGALTEAEREALTESARVAGAALRAAGYHGPFGVDAFRYRDALGAQAFQPRSEVNVRFTMGYPRALLEHALALSRQGEG